MLCPEVQQLIEVVLHALSLRKMPAIVLLPVDGLAIARAAVAALSTFPITPTHHLLN